MNHLRLLEWIGGLDEDLLERSERPIPFTKKFRWAPLVATAACLCLVCGLVLGAFGGRKVAMDSSDGAYGPPGEAESPEDRPLEDYVDDGEADKNTQNAGATDSDTWGLTLTVTEATTQGATLIFTQKGGDVSGELAVDTGWFLQLWQDGHWKGVPTVIPKDEIVWNTIAYRIPLGGELAVPIRWEHLYGTLDAGQYRIAVPVAQVFPSGQRDERICHGVFTLKE